MQRRLRRARLVTLLALAANTSAALFMPAIGLWREPDTVRVVLGALGILAYAAAQSLVLHAAVTPWITARARRRATVAFVLATVASVPLVGPLGAGWPSWSWLASSIVGVVVVLTGPWRAAILAAATTAVALGLAALRDDSLIDTTIIVAGVGLGVASINRLHVWFWDLLVQAEQGRAAQADLAASEERLRFARDVHDLLGHTMSVIALKAELAERLAPVDAGRAGREAAEVRRLAASALTELREVVHGYRRVDLREQLTSIEQVLVSSGVRCTVTVDGDLPESVAAPLAAVLREATTNVLRHSRAAWCTIAVINDGPEVRMTVTNDGAGAAGADGHSSGLRGLADRLAEHGGVLRTRAADGRFTVEAVVRSTP